jgi:hypothetical protein
VASNAPKISCFFIIILQTIQMASKRSSDVFYRKRSHRNMIQMD